MTVNRLIYFIVTAFVTGNVVLIFIQYTSDKAIGRLISDNEELLNEFTVNNHIETLEKDLPLVQGRIRDMVATGDTTYTAEVERLMTKVKLDLNALQKITDDQNFEEYIDQLDSLIQEYLRFNMQILDTYAKEGKAAAEALIFIQRRKGSVYSIVSLAERISTVRQNRLSRLTRDIDNSAKTMQRLDTFLIVFVLIAAAVLVWYIVNTIRTQSRLIQQVSDSEKKIKEVAKIKENFLANMSHEIRTPMNAILGFTNLLQQKNLDEESSHYVQTIQRSGENLLAIINDILDLSKIESGMMRIERVAFSLRGLMHSVETLLQPKTEEKGIQFFTRVEESLPDILEGDAIRLTQILVNLIGNAIKFTASGNVSVTIRNEGIEGNTITVGIAVSDTGIGISKEKLDGIFDRFQQADNAVTREYGGSGLGLSIVRELVDLQGGSIRAESEPGKGTTFHLSIPYKISKEQFQPDKTIFTQAGTASASLQKVRILVVEDNEVNQTLIQHLFRNWQVSFEIANNGLEAIEKLKTSEYNLILMDIQMPQMDGYTATQRIRKDLKTNIPIIAMTAHAMAGEREKCLSYGMNEYISKPIREEQLKKLIAQFVPFELTTSAKIEQAAASGHPTYRYINLAYMAEVSAGNEQYEKDVTMQFIEAVPRELEALEKAAQASETDDMRQIAHNLKTTVSVMGLDEVLGPLLDEIESGEVEEKRLKENVENIKRICGLALPEARDFLASFKK